MLGLPHMHYLDIYGSFLGISIEYIAGDLIAAPTYARHHGQ